MSRFYITTAIDYANGEPHLGHAYEKIGADAIARYRRLAGDDVRFLIGMDEHGLKVSQAAEARGLKPQDLVDRIAGSFEDTWRRLGISHDVFWRTTDPRHKAGVKALITRLAARNPDDLYEREYQGWYCVGCEVFKREAEIVDGKCPVHPTRELVWSKERNWFFRLTRYGSFLRDLVSRPGFLEPESRRNEMLALLDSGLEDISVTRARLSWAIPFPQRLSTGEEQGTWVWFDALPNYLTATGFPDPGWEQGWPAQLHVIGKDIVRLHTIIWPAMLEAAGLPLPERVWGHGFAYYKGERLSKSAGVTLDLPEAVARHGPDAFRYFVLREIPWDTDGNFSYERFDERYTSELADAFGNLASRVLAMLHRYREGAVPDSGDITPLDAAGESCLRRYREAMDALLLHKGAQAAWELVSEANGYVDREAPWNLAKQQDHAALDRVLASLARCLARLSVLASPFIPAAARTLSAALGLPASPDSGTPSLRWTERPQLAGLMTRKTPPLFPKDEALSGTRK